MFCNIWPMWNDEKGAHISCFQRVWNILNNVPCAGPVFLVSFFVLPYACNKYIISVSLCSVLYSYLFIFTFPSLLFISFFTMQKNKISFFKNLFKKWFHFFKIHLKYQINLKQSLLRFLVIFGSVKLKTMLFGLNTKNIYFLRNISWNLGMFSLGCEGLLALSDNWVGNDQNLLFNMSRFLKNSFGGLHD